MNRLPLSIKIFVAYTALIVVFLTTIIISTFNLFEASQREQIWEELESKSRLINKLIYNRLASENLDAYIKSLEMDQRTRITIIGKDGVVLADSEKNPQQMDNHLMRPEVQEANKIGLGTSIRYSVTVKSNMLYLAIPVIHEDKIVAFTRTSLWKTNVDDLSKSFLDSLLATVLWIILAALILALVLSKSILRPMEELVAFATRLPKEKFKTRSDVNRHDEIGDLSDSLNYMAGEIQTLFTKLETEKKEFELIVNTLQDPLLVVENNLKIRLSNKSFQSAFQHRDAVEDFLYNVVRSNDLIAEVETAFKTGRGVFHNIEHADRYYYVSITFIPSKNHVIIIFYDVTEQKQLEAQKRDFVSNVSHELRTPLTSIKGFVETLLEEEKDKDKSHYLEIIHRNTDRLINMTADLLALSSLENQEKPLNLEEANLLELIEKVSVVFNDKLAEKNISLSVESAEETIYLRIDQYRMEQVFINLIENAIKYSEATELRIRCTVSSSEVKIDVIDNGSGIEEEHLQRLFERFYVVDKSRSRKMGGTGLGLSLVKHIVQLHKGAISASSVVAQGTTFTITLFR